MITQHKDLPIPKDAVKVTIIDDEATIYFSTDAEIIKEQEDMLIDEAYALREDLKAERCDTMSCLTVTTIAGNVFNANEDSQNRMARAITIMDDIETIKWILADNTPYMVTRAELSEALRLAGEFQTSIWEIK